MNAVEEACRRFDLSPLEEDFLISHFARRQETDGGQPPHQGIFRDNHLGPWAARCQP